MTTNNLTPYDTGERLKPYSWTLSAEAMGRLDRLEAESYGNVDFDNEEGVTELTIHVSRNPEGGHTVHIIPQNDLHPITIETHEEN